MLILFSFKYRRCAHSYGDGIELDDTQFLGKLKGGGSRVKEVKRLALGLRERDVALPLRKEGKGRSD